MYSKFTIIVINVYEVIIVVMVIPSTIAFVHPKAHADKLNTIFCNTVINDCQIKAPYSSSRYGEVKDIEVCSNVDVLNHKILFIEICTQANL